MTDAVRLLSFFLGLSLLGGCVVSDVPPPGMVPTGPSVTRIEELGGTYCYYGPEFNVRAYGKSIEDVPFLPMDQLGIPSTIAVDASPREVVFRFAGTDGVVQQATFDIPARRAEWHGSALEVETSGGWGIHGGTNSASAVSWNWGEGRMYRLKDGTLALSFSASSNEYVHEKQHFDQIHRTKRSVVVLLGPMVGYCGGDHWPRTAQRRFEKGVDLSSPACEASLAEQIASILAQKGETPVSAADAAATTVSSFRSGGETADFLVETEAGSRTYSFRVKAEAPGCTLKLYHRTKVTKRSSYSGDSWASRPLPPCACND
jgi:hypothetical protein